MMKVVHRCKKRNVLIQFNKFTGGFLTNDRDFKKSRYEDVINYCPCCGNMLKAEECLVKNKHINSIEDLVGCGISMVALEDINRRITDWLASGGTMDDPYIKQQYRYADNIIERRKQNVTRN